MLRDYDSQYPRQRDGIDFIYHIILGARSDNNILPAPVVDLAQSHVRHITEYFNLMPWDDSDVARAAYEQVINYQDGGLVFTPAMSFLGLQQMVKRMCTAKEGGQLLKEAELTGKTAPPTREEKEPDIAAKASRLLANPRTPKATKQALSRAVGDLANAADTQVTHSALVERALTIMFESMKKRIRDKSANAERRDAYAQLVGLLSTIEEGDAK